MLNCTQLAWGKLLAKRRRLPKHAELVHLKWGGQEIRVVDMFKAVTNDTTVDQLHRYKFHDVRGVLGGYIHPNGLWGCRDSKLSVARALEVTDELQKPQRWVSQFKVEGMRTKNTSICTHGDWLKSLAVILNLLITRPVPTRGLTDDIVSLLDFRRV